MYLYNFVNCILNAEDLPSLQAVAAALVSPHAEPFKSNNSLFNTIMLYLQKGDSTQLRKQGYLPVDIISELRTLILQEFSDARLQFPTTAARLRSFVQQATAQISARGFEHLLRFLSTKEQPHREGSGNTNEANRAVLLLSWVFHPFDSIELLDGEAHALQALVSFPEVAFATRVREFRNCVSSLALYLVYPEMLTLR